jgi:hypothetical protein
MPDVRFDTYYRYQDLTRILQGYAEEYPHLVRLESVGKSYEGRAYKPSAPVGFDPFNPTNERAKVEWVVHVPEGGVVKLTARHERAGVLVAEVELQ